MCETIIICTCTVITPAREVNRNESTRNMVASRAATESSRPPIGYDTMPSDQQVHKWLDSFKGPIADAGYAESMIEAGYDCLENMVFSAEDLMASVDDMKKGHANRIARDAVAMLETMGNVIAQVLTVAQSPVAPTGIIEGGHPFCSGVLVCSGVFWRKDVPCASPRCLALRRSCAGTLVIDAPAKIFR